MTLARVFAGLLLAAGSAIAVLPFASGVGGELYAASALPLAPLLALAALPFARRARGLQLTALALFALSIVPLVRDGLDAPPRVAAQGRTLTIVTHNVAYYNHDPAKTLAALIDSGADVLLLQETDGAFAPLLPRLRARFPYGSRCVPMCSLAVFSRYPVDRVRYRFRDASGQPFGPQLVQTRVHFGDARVPVVAVHMPRGAPPAERELKRIRLAAATQRVGVDAMIIGGDFNMASWSPAMRRLENRLAPMERATHLMPSWADPRWPGPPLVAIDHVFFGPHWALASAERLARTGSDHYPIRVRLVWRPS